MKRIEDYLIKTIEIEGLFFATCDELVIISPYFSTRDQAERHVYEQIKKKCPPSPPILNDKNAVWRDKPDKAPGVAVRPLEPSPVAKGVDVSSACIAWLTSTGCVPTIALMKERRQFGINKYGQSLFSGDGRDDFHEIEDELGDGIAYAYKALLNRSLTSEQVDKIRQHLEVMTQILCMCDVSNEI